MGYIFDVSDAQKYRDTAVTRHSNPSKTGLFLVPRRAVRPVKKISTQFLAPDPAHVLRSRVNFQETRVWVKFDLPLFF